MTLDAASQANTVRGEAAMMKIGLIAQKRCTVAAEQVMLDAEVLDDEDHEHHSTEPHAVGPAHVEDEPGPKPTVTQGFENLLEETPVIGPAHPRLGDGPVDEDVGDSDDPGDHEDGHGRRELV